MLWQFRKNGTIISTPNFNLAMKLAREEFEEKKEILTKKKKEPQPKDWDKEFRKLVENYNPTPEIIKEKED